MTPEEIKHGLGATPDVVVSNSAKEATVELDGARFRVFISAEGAHFCDHLGSCVNGVIVEADVSDASVLTAKLQAHLKLKSADETINAAVRIACATLGVR